MSKKILCVVDIQPEYHEFCKCILNAFVDTIPNAVKTHDMTIFFFNGGCTSNDTETTVKEWLLGLGVDECTLCDITFIQKEYGFLRDVMNSNDDDDVLTLPDTEIITVLQELDCRGLISSNELETTEFLDIKNVSHEDWILAHEFNLGVEFPDFHFSELPTKLADANISLWGGGKTECLREIDLYLTAIGATTETIDDLVYGSDDMDIQKMQPIQVA